MIDVEKELQNEVSAKLREIMEEHGLETFLFVGVKHDQVLMGGDITGTFHTVLNASDALAELQKQCNLSLSQSINETYEGEQNDRSSDDTKQRTLN